MEKRIRVGCYGAKGSYTYEAMERHFGEREREEIYFPLFEDVTKAVAGGMIDYGVVPIENSSTGGITEVYDLIRGCGCAIVGEELVKNRAPPAGTAGGGNGRYRYGLLPSPGICPVPSFFQ